MTTATAPKRDRTVRRDPESEFFDTLKGQRVVFASPSLQPPRVGTLAWVSQYAVGIADVDVTTTYDGRHEGHHHATLYVSKSGLTIGLASISAGDYESVSELRQKFRPTTD